MARLTKARLFSDRVRERLDGVGAKVTSRQVQAILEELDQLSTNFDELYEAFHRAEYLSKKSKK